jgi:hypothetical protein
LIPTAVTPPSGFSLESTWLGRAREHRWRHTCGGSFMAPIQDLENAQSPKTGCKFCDEEGNPGRWMAFVRRLEERGLALQTDRRMEVLKEGDEVALSCKRHPESLVATWTRKKLTIWLAPNESGHARKLLCPCPACAAEESAVKAELPDSPGALKRQAFLADLSSRLAKFNHRILDWSGSSVRDASGKISTVKNKITCNACNTERESFVLQDLAKAEKRGSMACPHCVSVEP